MTADNNANPLDLQARKQTEKPQITSSDDSELVGLDDKGQDDTHEDLNLTSGTAESSHQNELVDSGVERREQIESLSNEKPRRWWHQGPQSWVVTIVVTEIIAVSFASVIISGIFYVVTEARETERQERAEQLENQRFVRTSILKTDIKKDVISLGLIYVEQPCLGLTSKERTSLVPASDQILVESLSNQFGRRISMIHSCLNV